MPDQKVERFNENVKCSHTMPPSPTGRWVRHSDYEKLEAERDEEIQRTSRWESRCMDADEERDEARKQRDEELRERLREELKRRVREHAAKARRRELEQAWFDQKREAGAVGALSLFEGSLDSIFEEAPGG